MSYRKTNLWKRTLGLDDQSVAPLRNSFLHAHDNVAFLLSRIRDEFPFLTRHDITHVDSLWRVADTIIGNKYPINPLEGYILGIAFLIHDVVLTTETFGGEKALHDTPEWNDSFASSRPPGMKEEDFIRECNFTAIRVLHGREAETILQKSFTNEHGEEFHILNEEKDEFSHVILRHFGDSIGKIAASHHWRINEVESRLRGQVNPLDEISTEWDVNEQKLACILRCADAGHIDNGRAPDSIYNSLDVHGVSRNHWEAQNHLCIVKVDKQNRKYLCITSSNPFPKSAFDAWNVAYDAIKQFDKELKDSNALLKRINEKPFPYVGVSGGGSKTELKNYVQTKDWTPCDFIIHTSNVKNLIIQLGGTALYGNDNALWVVLRELIQNARDAIVARSKLGKRFSIEQGKVTIRYYIENGVRTVEVEDNGIGMSEECIKSHLLDFGSSYWGSWLSKNEHPGLLGSGFSSIGKYGIGFYSVFMVADSVRVQTHKSGSAEQDAKCIEFPKGLTLSPILSDCVLDSEVSTVVRFSLKQHIKNTLKRGNNKLDLPRVLPFIVAGLDVDVVYEECGKRQLIHTSILSPSFNKVKWISDLCIPEPPDNIDYIASKLEYLKDEKGRIRGLIAPPLADEAIRLPSRYTISGNCFFHYSVPRKRFEIASLSTIGGLWSPNGGANSDNNMSYFGFIDFESTGISRSEFRSDSQLGKCLVPWVRKQYRENYVSITLFESLRNRYYKLISFCEFQLGLDIRQRIVFENERETYLLFRGNTVDIGFLKLIKTIQLRLFSGIEDKIGIEIIDKNDWLCEIDENELLHLLNENRNDLFAESEVENDNWTKVNSLKAIQKDELLSLLTILSGSNSLMSLLSKYIHVLNFVGRKRFLAMVWLNVMLNQYCDGIMVNWQKVNQNQLLSSEISNPDSIPSLLHSYLEPTESYLLFLIPKKN